MTSQYTDCREPDGITVGLVDTIITAARVLAGRDLSPEPVREALADLRSDEAVARLLAEAVARLLAEAVAPG